MRSKTLSTTIVATLALTFAFVMGGRPVLAVDEAEFFCNGASGPTCDIFQLDGADTATPNADACVGTENGCANEEAPVWASDWDALVNPNSFGTSGFTVNSNVGGGAGAGTFTLPWGAVGTFSGVFTSSLVSTGTSTILKQGSKNGNDISTWVVASQASPPKDAFLAAGLATLIGPPGAYNGETLLYHAATRFSPNGSATEGIWFFQEDVHVCSSGPSAGKALCDQNGAIAQHKQGDLFLFIAYSGSGSANIQAATWQGADGPAGFLGPAGTIVICPNPNDDACAVTNTANITLGSPSGPEQPGTEFNVSGPGFAGFANGVVPALQFQEGGVDLSRVLNGNVPCFSSVMFATVSSGSSPSTASLKAILLGNFNTCAISATKACGTGTVSAGATAITYPVSGVVSNIGGGAVHDLVLTDTFNNASLAFDTGSLTCTCNSACTGGPGCDTIQLNPGGSVNYSATITTASNGGSNVVTATMSGLGGGTATAQSSTATCPPQTLPDSITITKTCTPGASLVAQNGLVAVQVGVSGLVTNGSTTLHLSSVSEFDCINGTFGMLSTDPVTGCPIVPNNFPATCSGTLKSPTTPTPTTLNPSQSQGWSDSYFPSVAPSCGPFNFNDQVLVLGSCTSQFCQCAKVANVASAACPLCPGPTCP